MEKPARPKILALDDDSDITEFLRKRLGRDYELITTNDPQEALALAAEEQPDLILSDVGMPGMDGYQVCRVLKANEMTSEIPLIFLSGSHLQASDEKRGFEAGGVDYLNKTQDMELLDERLRVHLALRTARRALHNLRTTRVAAGVYWVQVPEAGLYILCGSPPDVVKHLMLKGYIADERSGGAQSETGPNVILLSDVLVQNGSFSNLAEFPVLQMLYRQGMILPGHPNNTGKKPMLIGSETQVRAQLDYIYRGNYGLVSEEEIKAAGVDEKNAKRLMALKLRFAFGEIKSTEDLLEFRVLGEEPVAIGNGVTARRVELNHFEFAYQGKTTRVDLNLMPGEAYESPYTPGQHQIEAQYFGVIHCGEGDGWDLRRQSMGSIVMFQGRFYLVDAGPSVLHTLKSLGIDITEIEGIFHTHAHDDHFAGLPALLLAGKRIKYFATPLVRHSVTKKLAALMSVEERLFADLFEVHDLVADQWNDCDGMEVMPQHSPHPVENTIFQFRVRDDDGYKSYAHWADIVSIDVLAKLVAESPAKEVLEEDYVEQIWNRYLTPATVKKIDAGGGLIHGAPLDFRGDRSEKIVLAHRAAPFSGEELEVGSQAIFGAVDVLVPTSQDYVRQRAFQYLSALFPGTSIEATNVLLRSTVTSFNAGSLLARSGTRAQHAYLLLGGELEHSHPHVEGPLALPVGWLLGPELIFGDGPLESTWRAASPVRVLRIGLETLRAFLLNGGWYGQLRTQMEETAAMRQTRLFGERIPLPELHKLARGARRLRLAAGASVPPGAKALYLLLGGSVDLVLRSGKVLETVVAGGFLGEEACLDRGTPDWSVKAREPCELVAFAPADLRHIPVVLWKLLEVHERRLRALEVR